MNLERMKQAAISNRKEQDKFAVVCTDGDFEYARTFSEAQTVLDEMGGMREFITGDKSHDYAIVRVDVDD